MEEKTAKKVFESLVNDFDCHFSNTYDGNMKLQKVLVFANLIHLARTEQKLFSDEMYAFKNGIVVEKVRKPFYENYSDYTNFSATEDNQFSNDEKESIELSVKLFYGLSATELSDLHHEFQTWKSIYHRSKIGNFHDKTRSVIEIEDIVPADIEKIKNVLNAYSSEDDGLLSETVNGITFYYNPNEINIDEHIIDYLEDISHKEIGEENTFYLTTDEKLGLYYY